MWNSIGESTLTHRFSFPECNLNYYITHLSIVTVVVVSIVIIIESFAIVHHYITHLSIVMVVVVSIVIILKVLSSIKIFQTCTLVAINVRVAIYKSIP